MNKLKLLILLTVVFLVSCGKTCRCYRYDGNVEEFDVAQLEEEGQTCVGMEDVDFGLTYSICEKVLF